MTAATRLGRGSRRRRFVATTTSRRVVRAGTGHAKKWVPTGARAGRGAWLARAADESGAYGLTASDLCARDTLDGAQSSSAVDACAPTLKQVSLPPPPFSSPLRIAVRQRSGRITRFSGAFVSDRWAQRYPLRRPFFSAFSAARANEKPNFPKQNRWNFGTNLPSLHVEPGD